MTRPGRIVGAYFALFAALYAVQGVVVAYFFTFNPIYLMDRGVAHDIAADVQSLALLPFVLKFLAGPFSDRFSLLGLGHRKPYIVLGLVVQTLGLFGLSAVDPGPHVVGFTMLAVLTVAGMALYDTCCDGMVIDITPVGDRDRVQGMLVASRALAAMACSVGFGLWMDTAGGGVGASARHTSVLLRACALLGLIPLALALVLPEPRRGDDADRFDWSALAVMARPRSLLLLGYGALYAVVAYGVEINLSSFYRALHFENGAIGAFAALRYVGRAVGGALLPLATRRLSRRGILVLGVVAMATTTGGQAAIGGPASAAVGGFLFGVANGWADALFFVLAMEASDPRMAASTYALFMAVTNVSVMGGSLFARVDAALGGHYRPTFLAAAGATLAALILVVPLGRPARPTGPGPTPLAP